MTQGLLQLLYEAIGQATKVLIMPHNDPDPDAIASAVALRHLLIERRGVEAYVVYKGIVGRAENKALVRYLGYPLHHLADLDLSQSAPIILVDTQPGAGNNALPPDRLATVVIDHHDWRQASNTALYSDVRPQIGSTSTILTEYLRAAALEPTPGLATALFYGIKTDTMGLSRGVTPADVAAYFYLQPRIEVEALVDIERAQVPAEYFNKLAATLQAAQVYDRVIISYVGRMSHPDLAAEMADLLLRLEGVQWVICIGAYENELILSVRTRDRSGGAGILVQQIVESDGTAGGHGTMAGGNVLLRGRDPKQLALQLSQRALSYLEVEPQVMGESLVEKIEAD